MITTDEMKCNNDKRNSFHLQQKECQENLAQTIATLPRDGMAMQCKAIPGFCLVP